MANNCLLKNKRMKRIYTQGFYQHRGKTYMLQFHGYFVELVRMVHPQKGGPRRLRFMYNSVNKLEDIFEVTSRNIAIVRHKMRALETYLSGIGPLPLSLDYKCFRPRCFEANGEE